MARYIDADKLLKCNCKGSFSECDTCLDEELCCLINDIPTADVQPVIHAKWINHTHTNGLGITFIDYECDACHVHIDTWKSDYCPNCGAKMEKRG